MKDLISQATDVPSFEFHIKGVVHKLADIFMGAADNAALGARLISACLSYTGIGLKSHSTLLWLQKPQASEQGAKGAAIAFYCQGAKEHAQKNTSLQRYQAQKASMRAEIRRKNMACASTVRGRQWP